MAIYFVLAVLIVLSMLLLKGIIDGWREFKRQKRLELYRRAELIGRRRLDECVSERLTERRL